MKAQKREATIENVNSSFIVYYISLITGYFPHRPIPNSNGTQDIGTHFLNSIKEGSQFVLEVTHILGQAGTRDYNRQPSFKNKYNFLFLLIDSRVHYYYTHSPDLSVAVHLSLSTTSLAPSVGPHCVGADGADCADGAGGGHKPDVKRKC